MLIEAHRLLGSTAVYMAARVHTCPHTFIGQLLDTSCQSLANYMILLALPRGLEPLFSP
jgi:hypothetical protein